MRPPIDPGDVEVYTSPPRHYEEIALLDASSVGSLGRASEAGTDEAIYRMKEDAAKLGANGVLLTGMADQYGGSLGVGIGGFGVSGGRSHVTAGGGSVGFRRADCAQRSAGRRDLRSRSALTGGNSLVFSGFDLTLIKRNIRV